MVAIFLSSSFLILFVLAFRRICYGKVSKRLQYGIWILVAVKLLLFPVPSLQSRYSPVSWNVIEKDAQETVISNAFVESAPVNKREMVKENALTEEKKIYARGKNIPALIWAVGSFAIFLFWASYNIRFLLYLKKNGVLLEGMEELKLPFTNKLPVVLVDKLPSPCLYGRTIYVNAECLASEEGLIHVLAHEYSHYKQRDMIWSLVRGLCFVIYWWNPLVLIGAAVSRQDCELACDERAIGLLGEDNRFAYGDTLLAFMKRRAKSADVLAVATTMQGGYRRTKQRILAIAKKQKRVLVVGISLVLLGIVAFLLTITVKRVLPAGEDEHDATDYVSKVQDETSAVQEEIIADDRPMEADTSGEDVSANKSDAEATDTGIWDYSGYLDEATCWTGREAFVDKDYDGDGKLDRIYRSYQATDSGNDFCIYTFAFGNGDILKLDKLAYTGFPKVQAADFDGDGSNEILFLQSYDTSTDPTSAGDMAFFARRGKRYEQVVFPLPGGGTNGGGFYYYLPTTYRVVDSNVVEVSVTNSDLTFPIHFQEGEVYTDEIAGDAGCQVYSAEIMRDGMRSPWICCHASLLGKWIGDEIHFDLVYQDGGFEIRNMHHIAGTDIVDDYRYWDFDGDYSMLLSYNGVNIAAEAELGQDDVNGDVAVWTAKLELSGPDHRFFFSQDPLSSYIPAGSYQVHEGYLYAVSTEGEDHYTFRIVDENALEFVASQSSPVIDYTKDISFYYPPYDGAIFVKEIEKR